MESGRFFSIEFVTADIKRRKGGRLKAYAQACKLSYDTPHYVGTGKKSAGRGNRKPRQDNETIKLHIPTEPRQQDRIREVHLYLITKFNGQEVV